MNTQLIKFLWLLLFLPSLIYSQAPIWPLNPTNWNKISCTFSELHGASANHVHAALDINCDANDDPLDANGNPIPITSTRFRAVLDGQIEGLVIGNYAFLTTIHDYPSGQPDEYLFTRCSSISNY